MFVKFSFQYPTRPFCKEVSGEFAHAGSGAGLGGKGKKLQAEKNSKNKTHRTDRSYWTDRIYKVGHKGLIGKIDG